MGAIAAAHRGGFARRSHHRHRNMRPRAFWSATPDQPAQQQQPAHEPPARRAGAGAGAKGAGAAGPPRRDFLEARQVSLLELFSGSAFKFDVPDYQRPYSWRHKQVYELLADLQAAFASGQEYFLGAIVTTRPGDGACAPYQVIDGQQRLTTLVMMVAFLRHWAAQQPGGAGGLDARLQSMLHLERDPLDPASAARYRLQLRPADAEFFRSNVVDHYLPWAYHLAAAVDNPSNAPGAAAPRAPPRPARSGSGSGSGGDAAEGGAGGGGAAAAAAADGSSSTDDGGGAAAAASGEDGESYPLANETWWRLYQAASFVRGELEAAVAAGLPLQEFMLYVLRSSYVVVMTARDEAASFKIFSTLNGRGVDLGVVDKIKADLLQALPAAKRGAYADRWLEIESLLGRPSFHRLFDHLALIDRAAGRERGPAVSDVAASGGAGGAATGGAWVARVAGGGGGGARGGGEGWSDEDARGGPDDAAAPGARAPGGGASASLLRHFGRACGCERDTVAALESVLDYGSKLLMIRQNDWGQLRSEGGTGPVIASQLEEVCFFINLFRDDSWQPWALEFFCRSDDDQKRLDFLRGAEVLQLYCEVRGDAAYAHERWLQVGRELLQRPFYWDRVQAALALSLDEQEDFLHRLGARDLAAECEERTLAHLLLRADSISRARVDWRRLKVEKILPHHPPEGSLWRRTKILVPEDGSLPADGAVADAPAAGSGGGGGFVGARPALAVAGGARASLGGGTQARASGADAGSAQGSRRGSTGVGGLGGGGGGGGGSWAGAADGGAYREVKYWYEVQRSHWHNRIGNLVLLQPSVQAARVAPSGHLSADIDAKVAYYAACGADEAFPEFTGGLVTGRYTRDKFSPEEARARHADIVSRLAAALNLCQVF